MDSTEPSPPPPPSEPGPKARKKRRGYYARLDLAESRSLRGRLEAPSRGARGAGPLERGERDAAHVLVLGGDLGGSEERSLPLVCLKCGSHKRITRRPTKLRWTPLWARMLVFCALGLLLMFVMTKRAELDIPLCAACSGRWDAARNAQRVGVVALVVSLVGVRLAEDPLRWLPVFGVVFVAFLVMSVMFVRPRMLQVHKIDDAYVYLKGFHRGAAEEIVEGSA